MKTSDLFRISKFSFHESYLESQLAMSGSNYSMVMEKLEKNTEYLKTNSIVMKIMTVVYMAMTVLVPIQTFKIIGQALMIGISPDWLLFTGSLLMSLVFLSHLALLLMFGIYFSSGIFSGTAFTWLSTLPMEKKDVKKVVLFSFYRAFDWQLWTILFIIPIGTAIITRSVLMTVSALILSAMNVLFIFGIIVGLGQFVARILITNMENSRKQTIVRLTVMLGIILFGVIILLGIQLGLPAITELMFMLNPPIDTATLNQYLGLIPYPINSGYVLIAVYMGVSELNSTSFLMLVIGMALYIGTLILMFKRSFKKLKNVLNPEESKSEETEKNGKNIKSKPVIIQTSGRKKAFFKKDLQMISRDMQMVSMFMLPVMYAGMAFLMQMLNPEENMLTFPYILIADYFIMVGVIKPESTGSTINASLPIIGREQLIGKFRWFIWLQATPYLSLWLFQWNHPMFIQNYLKLVIDLFYGITFGIGILLLKIRLFGKKKYSYALTEIHPQGKSLKWAIMIIPGILSILGFFMLTGRVFEPFGVGLYASILGSITIALLVIIIIIMNKMFPKHAQTNSMKRTKAIELPAI